jgi:predicted lipoprotein with Yx(FWY)xxD motif
MVHRRSARLVLAAAAAGLALTACGTPAEPESQPEPSPAAASQHQQHQQHQQHEQHQQGQQQPGGASSQQHHHGGGGVQMWATQTSSLGIVALDGAGRILYRSDADLNNPPTSRCTGECTQRWVPLALPEGQEVESLGVDSELIGTLRRGDGTNQVTLAGWPLYTVAGDNGAHDGTGAHGTDGTWFAVTPTGDKANP